MHESGTTDIHVFYEEPWMSIAIIDHGGGLDPALADTIFQPFITSKTGGSGLGLVITRQIIESHHGTLTCDSRPGDGCTFTITHSAYAKLNTVSSIRRILKLPFAVISPVIKALWNVILPAITPSITSGVSFA